jgi:hypothetical protein
MSSSSSPNREARQRADWSSSGLRDPAQRTDPEERSETVGLALEEIVSGCVYLRDLNDYQPMNAVYHPYFSRGLAVRTCLMPNSCIEKNTTRVQASFIAARKR